MVNNDLDYFKLMRNFWDWAFENPELIKPNHCALFAFIVEHCNRLGWKHKFGLPTEMTKEAIGIRSYHTYIKTLNDLVDLGFIEMIERSKNQHSSNIVALIKNDKAHVKALDKAFIKHASKQHQSTCKSNDSIDKQYTSKQYTSKQRTKDIISYLNSKSGKSFKSDTKKTVECIRARYNEGYTYDDFIKVIDVKVAKWKNDPKMQDFIRPETLFSNKFESYLNEQEVKPIARSIFRQSIL